MNRPPIDNRLTYRDCRAIRARNRWQTAIALIGIVLFCALVAYAFVGVFIIGE